MLLNAWMAAATLMRPAAALVGHTVCMLGVWGILCACLVCGALSHHVCVCHHPTHPPLTATATIPLTLPLPLQPPPYSSSPCRYSHHPTHPPITATATIPLILTLPLQPPYHSSDLLESAYVCWLPSPPPLAPIPLPDPVLKGVSMYDAFWGLLIGSAAADRALRTSTGLGFWPMARAAWR